MQVQSEYGRAVRKLEKLMGDHLGLYRGDLRTRVKLARRRLPAKVKRDVLAVADAQHLSGHPRIAPQIDKRAVKRAYKRAVDHLRGPAPREARKTRRVGAVAALAVNLLLLFVAVIGVMVWVEVI